MPASAAYLTKYLTASNKDSANSSNPDFEDSSRPKKRRKKDATRSDKYLSSAATGTLLIEDDDAELSLRHQRKRDRDDEDADGPMIFEGNVKSADFRKKKTSAWQTVQDQNHGQETEAGGSTRTGGTTTSGPGPGPQESGEQDDADQILAAAASESARRRAAEQDDEAPAVVDMAPEPEGSGSGSGPGPGPRMSSGVKAGLQTAADTAALLLAAENEARARAGAEQRSSSKNKKKARERDAGTAAEAEAEDNTIYRDATGRRIDISLRRQEARAAEVARLVAEKREREAATGDVQRAQKEERLRELDEAKFLTIGRGADDEEMNERMKDELRWDDPMAQYMAERQREKEQQDLVDHRGKSNRSTRARRGDGDGDVDMEMEVDVVVRPVKKKEYQGAAPPNRYGIKPGWRWDGVDRGNGFEKEWFQARGRKARNENLEYQWAMDE